MQTIQKNILVVDDNIENLRFIGALLKTNQFNPILFERGIDALNYIRKKTPDIILLDIMMPEMDGIEVCRRIKENPLIDDIPIIFLTAKVASEDIVKGFAAGGVDYITKPFNSAELMARLNAHLVTQEKERQLEQSIIRQKELLHILFHDISNPILSSHYFLGVVDSPEELWAGKDLIEKNIRTSYEIIKLVKKLKLLEDEKIEFPTDRVDLKLALSDSYSILENVFLEKNIKLKINIHQPIYIHAEKTSLVNSVLNNIFTNGIKFSEPGTEIHVELYNETETEVYIQIQDHGIGIPKKLLKNLFDSSVKTHRKGTKGEEGFGFGIHIIFKFMSLYKGSIDVKSQTASEDHSHQSGTIITLGFQKYLDL